ncbi:hypothetical protein GQ42DRAFT_77648 [Ramicandelaber brevisporus]|nr:hypothetical protein GQ42DRAFT_77648 [Ramicandelaber brevisporus]
MRSSKRARLHSIACLQCECNKCSSIGCGTHNNHNNNKNARMVTQNILNCVSVVYQMRGTRHIFQSNSAKRALQTTLFKYLLKMGSIAPHYLYICDYIKRMLKGVEGAVQPSHRSGARAWHHLEGQTAHLRIRVAEPHGGRRRGGTRGRDDTDPRHATPRRRDAVTARSQQLPSRAPQLRPIVRPPPDETALQPVHV